MVKTPVFKGACTAIVTPFTEHGIDYERLGRNINYQYENGVSAIVVCGTTGENATVSRNEYEEIVRYAIRETNGRMKVIVGVGSNNTDTALKNAENALCRCRRHTHGHAVLQQIHAEGPRRALYIRRRQSGYTDDPLQCSQPHRDRHSGGNV